MVGIKGKHLLVIPSAQVMTKHYPLGGIFEFNQAGVLMKAGYKVGVISINLDSLRFLFSKNDTKEFEVIDGVPIFRSNKRIFSVIRFGRHTKYILRNIERSCDELYQKYIAVYGIPDVIHAHDLNYGAYCAFYLNKQYGIPYIVTWHSSDIYEKYNHKSSNIDLEIEVLKKAEKVIAVSNAVARALEERYNLENVHVVFNVLEPEFEYYNYPLSLQERDFFQFISIGSLDSNKNHELLITAFAKAFKATSCRLSIGGTGYLFKKLKMLSIELGVNNQVKFLGHLNRNEVVQALVNSDCLVLSSNHETFGVVLIEALSMGIPVISTRCGGANDIVNETNGLLVNKMDVDSMINGMKDIIKRKDQFDRKKLRKDVIERFGSESFVRNIDAFISEN